MFGAGGEGLVIIVNIGVFDIIDMFNTLWKVFDFVGKIV